jgi:hypothetical protein
METTSPPWNQQRFLRIEVLLLLNLLPPHLCQAEIKSLLVELQFGPKALRCVPVSSLEGVNLVPSTGPGASDHEAALRQWYRGPSLLEMINTFKEPPRMINRPLRASILTILTESARGFQVAPPSLPPSLMVTIRFVRKCCKEDCAEEEESGSRCFKACLMFERLRKMTGALWPLSSRGSWGLSF